MQKKFYHYLATIPFLTFLLLTNSFNVSGQEVLHYQNEDFHPFGKVIYQPDVNFHTSIKPYSATKLNTLVNIDSLLYDGIRVTSKKLNLWRRFFNDDLLKWEDDDITVKVNPLFNFEAGQEMEESKRIWTNTRGLMIEGSIGKHFYFYTDFLENQAVFPNYIDNFVRNRKVVPGEGKSKNFDDLTTEQHDYSQATGFISFNLLKYFNIQLGNGKNFIGDGYRSLLLSDNAYSYPYLKFVTEFKKVKYMIMWAQLRDLNIDKVLEGNDARYPEKYIATHYLDMNIGKRFSIGLFESVVWAAQDTTGYRGFDYSYLNPIVFFRPVEYAAGSPDNMTMGLNLKYILGKKNALYGQFVLGEFKGDEVFSGKKWWANKQGFQIGLKAYDLFGINKLDFLTEYNQVRPYTYSHSKVISNYGHYNQELAHPLGANFRESVTKIKYQYHRFIFNSELMVAMYGKDFNDGISYGSNIYMDNDDRPGDYGHTIGQGLKTNLLYVDVSLSYLINPQNNFNIAIGGRIRKESNDNETNNTQMVWFALRTSLKNIYRDF